MRQRFSNGFSDRRQAGRALAELLRDEQLVDPIVLGIPRGGVPVAAEIAQLLDCPLEVLVARKIGAPDQPEFAIGAIAEGGALILDERSVRALRLSDAQLSRLRESAKNELERRVQRYRDGLRAPEVAGRSVVVVDDGIATGRTVAAALISLRQRSPGRLVLATPVCAPDAARRLGELADEVICLLAPQHLMAVGFWYGDFSQTTDAEVVGLLADARSR